MKAVLIINENEILYTFQRKNQTTRALKQTEVETKLTILVITDSKAGFEYSLIFRKYDLRNSFKNGNQEHNRELIEALLEQSPTHKIPEMHYADSEKTAATHLVNLASCFHNQWGKDDDTIEVNALKKSHD